MFKFTFELYFFFLWLEPLTVGTGQEMDACLEENRWSWTPALHLRGLFGVQECLQGSNWKIRSAKGAKALRDKQWGDEAWIRITHAGKCGEIEREREGEKHRHGFGNGFLQHIIHSPVTSQVHHTSKLLLWWSSSLKRDYLHLSSLCYFKEMNICFYSWWAVHWKSLKIYKP